MNNDTVKACLSHRYIMKLHKHTPHENDNSTTHKWPQFLPDDVQQDNIYIMNEFICIRCRNSLRHKNPKMPDQACANGLQLHDIPQDLQNILPLERRIISPRIPFITILVMKRYGGHYKVNGPPVNVPATLDQIIEILPRMPSDLQLHPVKLKCKLEYKTHYMYDMICRDHVMSAITWLKEHNFHYENITLNKHWYSDIAAGDFSLQLDESDNRITMNEDIAHKQSQNMTDISKVTQQTDNMQVPYTTEITSTNVENINMQNNEDTEEAEEQIAINRRQELTGDPLPTVVQYEHLENQIYQCAPGENNIPKYILLDNDFEVLAFPDLFPYGSGGYHSANRKVKLPIRKYFQQCLLNIDGRFAQNIEYLFCAQYIADIKQIESDAMLAICLSRGRTLGGHKITAGQLRNPTVVEQLVRNEQAYKFLKNVRGSPAYWQDQLYDVLAMLRMLSIPTWFLTLSAADLHWPEMIQAVAVQLGKKLTQKDVQQMSIKDRSTYLCQNPITGVRMFQHRLEAFFSEYLLSDTHPLGHITDYVIKIEFQMRGSPHAHCLLWVKDAPKIDKDPDDVVCAFIDKYITAEIPPVTSQNEHQIKLMNNLQKHTHSEYCRKNKSCHFGFPKPPATKTLISRPPLDDDEHMIENAKSILQTVQNTLTTANIEHKSTQELLQDINLHVDTYMEALQISHKGPNIILK